MNNIFPDGFPEPKPPVAASARPRKAAAKAPRVTAKSVARPANARGGKPEGTSKAPEFFSGAIEDVLAQLSARGFNIESPRAAGSGKRESQERSRYEAQELVFEAMEAKTPAKAAVLCGRALAIDPDCADAIALLARTEKLDNTQLEQRLRDAVAAGERTLGKKLFKELRGEFWGFHETRPYMRARMALADHLLRAGNEAEAMSHYEELLELNTNDNNGLRYLVVPLHLKAHRLDRAEHWLGRYNEEESAFFAWAIVLLRWARRDEPGAIKALRAARSINPHAEKYLSGTKPVPARTPDLYSPGQESEAIHATVQLVPAYAAHAGASAWLAAQAAVAKPVQKK